MQILVFILITMAGISQALPWPTYQNNYHRSGYTTEDLPLPLAREWVWTTTRKPVPANAETPAQQDFWQGLYGNKSRVPIDDSFRAVVSEGKVFFGSSNSDKLICLDAADGTELWKHYTGGPIRFAPTVYSSRVYFGSDDGYVYCLDCSDGSLIWRYNAGESNKRMFADGRFVSTAPVRTGVVVDNGVAYWGVGLFSGMRTGLVRYIVACDAVTGSVVWKKTPPRPTQGYPLVSGTKIYMPAGKSQPTYYSRGNGSYIGTIGVGRQGGSYVLLSNDNKLYVGPHYSGSGSYIQRYDANTGSQDSVAWGPGNHLVVTDNYSYYSSDAQLAKINRSSKSVVWAASSQYPYELILAGDTLFAGGDNSIAAIDSNDGTLLWTEQVAGRVKGIAVADGGLFVSTDRGYIHCFRKFTPGDIDMDSDIDLNDFSIFAGSWLISNCNGCVADIAGDDGEVDVADLLVFSENWLKTECFRQE